MSLKRFDPRSSAESAAVYFFYTAQRLSALTKRRQFHQIAFWHGLDGLPGFAPSGQAAVDHKGTKSLLPE